MKVPSSAKTSMRLFHPSATYTFPFGATATSRGLSSSPSLLPSSPALQSAATVQTSGPVSAFPLTTSLPHVRSHAPVAPQAGIGRTSREHAAASRPALNLRIAWILPLLVVTRRSCFDGRRWQRPRRIRGRPSLPAGAGAAHQGSPLIFGDRRRAQ